VRSVVVSLLTNELILVSVCFLVTNAIIIVQHIVDSLFTSAFTLVSVHSPATNAIIDLHKAVSSRDTSERIPARVNETHCR
jgi:hypothetical protein